MITDHLSIYYPKIQGFVTAISAIERVIGEIDVLTLVKEVGQNSLDAAISSDTPVKLEFNILKISKEQKKEALSQIGLIDPDLIIENLRIMAETDKNEQNRFEEMIDVLEDENDIYFLVISDFNTYGLTGDDDLSLQISSRFQGYNYKLGISQKESNRGSFGEGRMAALAASKIQYVFEVSNLAESWKGENFRVFGLGIHGLFEKKRGEIQSGVLFSCRLDGDNEVRSLMLDSLDEMENLIPSDREKNTGTSFIFPFFDPKSVLDGEFDEEKAKELFLEEILAASSQIFFPSIVNKKFQVEVKYSEGRYQDIQKSGKLNKSNVDPVLELLAEFSEDTDIPETMPYIDMLTTRTVNLEIPQGRGNDRLSVDLPIKIIGIKDRFTEAELPIYFAKYLNRVIFSRNGMVIEAYDPKLPLFQPFVALLDVNKEEFPEAHKFFRLSEPVKHDEWKNTAKRLKDTYGVSAGPQQMRDFKRNVRSTVRDLFGYDISNTETLGDKIKEQLFGGLGLKSVGIKTTRNETAMDTGSILLGRNRKHEKKSPDENGRIKASPRSGNGKKRSPVGTKPTPTKGKSKPRNPQERDNTRSRRSGGRSDIIRLEFGETKRREDELELELLLPNEYSTITNIRVQTVITTYEGIFDHSFSYTILDRVGNSVDTSKPVGKEKFPLKALISTKNLPRKLSKNVNLSVFIGGDKV